MPTSWGLVGHEWAVQLLVDRLAAGRSRHAYLITGPQSIGKATLAVRLAQAMVCQEPDPPCGACRACTLIGRGQHPDLHYLEPQDGWIRIEAIRDLQAMLPLRPMEAPVRIALINGLDYAREQAMDALLKTLEEPPSTSRLILTASLAESLLPTIVSRCQVIALRPVPDAPIAEALMAQLGLPRQEADALARLSGGRPGWAFNAASDSSLLARHTQAIDWLLAALTGGRHARFALADELARQDDVQTVLEIWQAWWRDVMLVATGCRVTPVHIDRLDELQPVAERAGSAAACRALAALSETQQYLRRSVNTRLALEVMLLEMPYL